jgi:hypothetical protein
MGYGNFFLEDQLKLLNCTTKRWRLKTTKINRAFPKSHTSKKKLISNTMKYLLLSLLLIFASSRITAQNSIPNGNFENWNSNTFEYPANYPFNSNQETVARHIPGSGCVKTADAYHGLYAVEITTLAGPQDTAFGYFLNHDPKNSEPNFWTGGIPYNQMPKGIRGYYKYNGIGNDSGGVIIVFSKAGVNIGTYFFSIGGVKTAYTLFNLNFSPALTVTPDSVIIGFTSSNINSKGNGTVGSKLKIDSISFTGVTSQPAAMNGDFESWQSQTLYDPASWYLQDVSGVTRTTDAAAGNYAINLITYLGDNNGNSQARGASISTGYYDNSCSCEKGGFPFSGTVDTLVFSYKYIPVNLGDSAEVDLNFKKNGSSNNYLSIRLGASATYKQISRPFNLFSAPDSVIIQIQSSVYNDTALSFVGANFKIDEIHFKSQPLHTGIQEIKIGGNDILIYPNPITYSSTIEISPNIAIDGMKLYLYDIYGRTIIARSVENHKMILDKKDLCNGTYFYQLTNETGLVKRGKLVVE